VRVLALTRRNGLALRPMLDAGLDVVVREGGECDHLSAAFWLRKQVRDWSATHLWTSLSRATILGLLIGPQLRIPVIAWQHNAFLKPWNRRLLRLLQSRAAIWVADSHSVAELTAKRLKVDNDRLMTWPIYFADAAMPRARPWQPGTELRIGSLGRLHAAKGYDVLIAALAKMQASGFVPLAPFSIMIGGEGADARELADLAQANGVRNITFAGYLSDTKAFLESLHLYIQPSRREGFCIAAHEAMSAGLPIIASATGEMAISVADGQMGWLVPPCDVDALAHALTAAIREPGVLAQMGDEARSRIARKFSRDRFRAGGKAIVAKALSA